MGTSNQIFPDQRLQARITGASKKTYWYANMIGEKFEVLRNPQGIKLVNHEADKMNERLGYERDIDYYIQEEDCRLIRI